MCGNCSSYGSDTLWLYPGLQCACGLVTPWCGLVTLLAWPDYAVGVAWLLLVWPRYTGGVAWLNCWCGLVTMLVWPGYTVDMVWLRCGCGYGLAVVVVWLCCGCGYCLVTMQGDLAVLWMWLLSGYNAG